MNEDQVRQMLNSIEPLRLAHRVDPRRTWLFSGKYDDVVPPSSAQKLSKLRRSNNLITSRCSLIITWNRLPTDRYPADVRHHVRASRIAIATDSRNDVRRCDYDRLERGKGRRLL